MDKEKIALTLNQQERQVLIAMGKASEFSALIQKTALADVEVMRALQWLENKGLVVAKKALQEVIVLDENGERYRKYGLPEKRFLDAIKEKPKTLPEIEEAAGLDRDELTVSLGALKSKAAIEFAQGKATINDNGKKLLAKGFMEEKFLAGQFPMLIDKLDDVARFSFDALKKRKKIVRTDIEKKITAELTELGSQVAKIKVRDDLLESVTPELIKSGRWKGKEFRHYDVSATVPVITGGRRHPYNEACNILRDLFLEMGFSEMEGPWVETAFWNMDSMWIPQDHPARDIQDTFFIGVKGDLPAKELVAKVAASHENGFGTGSSGHTEKWNPEIARQLLMRTHSTATTFRMLERIGRECPDKDCKYFYIATNFRNEAVDATHLFEFSQAEGFIMADSLTPGDLMGFIKEFYAKLGIKKIRFKPTFNPYTEPSIQAYYFDEKKKKWYALINSGIFRPEALAPYGIKKTVIAWGMGSARVAAILTGVNRLPDLVGATCDFEWIKSHKMLKRSL